MSFPYEQTTCNQPIFPWFTTDNRLVVKTRWSKFKKKLIGIIKRLLRFYHMDSNAKLQISENNPTVILYIQKMNIEYTFALNDVIFVSWEYNWRKNWKYFRVLGRDWTHNLCNPIGLDCPIGLDLTIVAQLLVSLLTGFFCTVSR